MALTVTRISLDRYQAIASPPHVKEDWQTPYPMPGRRLSDELLSRGCHQTDIADALHEADPKWIENSDKDEGPYPPIRQYEQIPRLLRFTLTYNPTIAVALAIISALCLFGIVPDQTVASRGLIDLLAWLNIFLAVAWLGCAYLGMTINRFFPDIYALLGAVNLVVSGGGLIRLMMLGVPAGYGVFALLGALYLLAWIPVLYSSTAHSIFDGDHRMQVPRGKNWVYWLMWFVVQGIIGH